MNSAGDVTTYGDLTFKNNLKGTNTTTNATYNMLQTWQGRSGAQDTSVSHYSMVDNYEYNYLEADHYTLSVGASYLKHNGVANLSTINGYSLTITGSKSRVVETNDYNDRLLYCYETPSPLFGDIGHGIIGEDGKCYVYHDVVFLETINTKQDYQVFLQSYSQNNVWVAEKTHDYFVVAGEPNTEFDWEIKAKQRDYEITRLEEMPNDEVETDRYEEMAQTYLDNYEKELLV